MSEVREGPWNTVEPGYRDVSGAWREAPQGTRRAFAERLAASAQAPERAARIFTAETPVRLPAGVRVRLEDGGEPSPADLAQRGLPVGYHRWSGPGEQGGLLLAPPARFPAAPPRAAGVAVQTYALRSKASPGLGDLGDLADFGRLARRAGADFLLLGPMGDTAPGEPSPYYPSSRIWRHPLLLAVERVPGAEAAGEELARLRADAADGALDRRIDRRRVAELETPALRRAFAASRDSAEFAAWVRRQGEGLHLHAAHGVLAERHGPDWRSWPAAARHPRGSETRALLAEAPEALGWRLWLQWALDLQLARSAGEIDLVTDLAVGLDRSGADAWRFQEVLASGVSVGAPPDPLGPEGQDWGVAPFLPGALADAEFAPWRETVAATLRHARGLRLDHVMGLWRLYWIALGARAEEGAYVRYPAQALLAVLAIECARSGAFTIGEDLGTVEPEVRARLAAVDALGYRLACFEDTAAEDWPPSTVAALTTHDLPTLMGLVSGADLVDRAARGLAVHPEESAAMLAKLSAFAGIAQGAEPEEFLVAAHTALAKAPSRLRIATLDDLLGVHERPNVPGTRDEWPNWRIALPVLVEDIADHPLFRRVTAAFLFGR